MRYGGLKAKDFPAVYQRGRKFRTEPFIAYFLPAARLEVGVAAAVSLGNAVQRNRAKRLLREALRRSLSAASRGQMIVKANQAILRYKEPEVREFLIKALGGTPLLP